MYTIQSETSTPHIPEQKTTRKVQENQSSLRLSGKEPLASTWREKDTYDAALVRRYLTPLREEKQTSGAISVALQTAVLNDLHWYFTVDLRERAPTVVVNELMAAVFHEHVREIMAYIDHNTIASLDSTSVSLEVRHALFSYQAPACHSPVVIDAYDHDQRLVRLSYFVHGTPPAETFLIDGKSVKPAHSKYRGCRFFRRMLLRQRIVWLLASEAKTIQVLLDEQPAELGIGKQGFLPARSLDQDSTQSFQAVRDAFPPGKGLRQLLPSGLTGLKIRLVRWLAQLPLVRKRFEKSWIFLDRFNEADDNAEHLYRWVRQHHPEINAWFLLDRSSTDWNRLAAEGFRLMPPGWLRKLLVLNSEHIISSHAEYMYGGFDPRYYGDMMKWKYCFLQHGVIKDDLSHWLSNKPFDLFVNASPAEQASIVDDDTAYTYTTNEVQLTGLPRHDSLLAKAQDIPLENVDIILVMPTWRGSLSNAKSEVEIATSDYFHRWGSLLRSCALIQLVTQHGKRLVFMPHTNAVPYLKYFKIPDEVEIYTKADIGIQMLFSRSIAMITDYSSVAFEMAYLRRLVFHYQFDRQAFYSGNHNWREGYFDYSRDGFGPVAFDEATLISRIEEFLSNNTQTVNKYIDRMETALPLVDGRACERIYEAVTRLNRVHIRSLEIADTN